MKKIMLIDQSDAVDLVANALWPNPVAHFTEIVRAEESLRQSDYSMILVDISVSGGDGLLFLNRISSHPKYSDVPKIIISGRTSVEDKLIGFNSGAVDYVTKPFHPLELKARVHAHLSASNRTLETFRSAFVEFNLNHQICQIMEGDRFVEEIALTPIEFKIFLVLVKSSGKVVSRETLAKKVWGEHGLHINVKGIDTHLSHLRKKLKHRSASIVSVYGRGFYFDPDKVPIESVEVTGEPLLPSTTTLNRKSPAF